MPECVACRAVAHASAFTSVSEGWCGRKDSFTLARPEGSCRVTEDFCPRQSERERAMVRKKGLEPSRPCGRQPLKLVRLPIPPLPRLEGLPGLLREARPTSNFDLLTSNLLLGRLRLLRRRAAADH